MLSALFFILPSVIEFVVQTYTYLAIYQNKTEASYAVFDKKKHAINKAGEIFFKKNKVKPTGQVEIHKNWDLFEHTQKKS